MVIVGGKKALALILYEGERKQTISIYVEGVTLVLPSRLFMFNKYWRILALS